MLQSKVFNKKTRGGRIQKVCFNVFSLLSLYASSLRVFSFVRLLFVETASERGLSTR